MKIDLQADPKPAMFRVATKNDSPKKIDKTGGDFGGGLIHGMSAITRGPALGHNLWIDDVFLSQVESALNAAEKYGVKSRFTHPDMSADGLAKFLGRAKFGRLENGQVFTELHLAKSAHKSPDGDLAGYVLSRTEEDPGSFGASIVFYRDEAAETEFALTNGATINDRDRVDWSGFASPDPDNTEGLRHARLASLEAADLVDEPAANPSGMFHANPVSEFASLADFALGLSEEVPAESTALSVNPDRLKGFVDRYLANRGLQIVPVACDPPANPPPPEMSAGDDAPETPAKSDPPPPEMSAGDRPADPPTGCDRTLADYCAAFGTEAGATFVLQGVSFADAQTQYIAALKAKNDQLAAQLALAGKEHASPIPLGTGRKTFRELTRIRS